MARFCVIRLTDGRPPVDRTSAFALLLTETVALIQSVEYTLVRDIRTVTLHQIQFDHSLDDGVDVIDTQVRGQGLHEQRGGNPSLLMQLLNKAPVDAYAGRTVTSA